MRCAGECVTASGKADAVPVTMHNDSSSVNKCFLGGRMYGLSNLGFRRQRVGAMAVFRCHRL